MAAAPDATGQADQPWERLPHGIRLQVRLTPKGGADRVEGAARDAEGRAHLAARVSAPPDKGAANAALEKLLAKWLGVPKRDVTLTRGHTARVKTLEITGEPVSLELALRAALGL